MSISPMFKNILICLLTICLVVSLLLFIKSTDLLLVMKLVSAIGYKFTLLLLITFFAYLFGTISWQFTLGNCYDCISTGKLFLIRHVGEIAGMLNPASIIGGDALKAYLLKGHEIPEKTIISSMLLSRLILIASQLLLLLTLALVFSVQQPMSVLTSDLNTNRSVASLTLPLSFKSLLNEIKNTFIELPSILKENKGLLLLSCICALFHWGIGGIEFYFILKFLGLKTGIIQALLVDLGVVLFKAAGAFIPGQLGIEEYGNKIMLMAIGLPGEEVWITASILRRARQLCWILFGVVIYLLVFRKRPVYNGSTGNSVYNA